jgi:hypothetical protein
MAGQNNPYDGDGWESKFLEDLHNKQMQSYQPQQAIPQNKSALGDLWTGVKQGALQIPGAVTGLADIPVALATGYKPFDAATNYLGEATGFQPGKWAKSMDAEKTPEYHAQRQNVDRAWGEGGFWNIAGAYADNPRAVGDVVAQSLAPSIVGGLAGRAALGVGSRAVGAEAGAVGPALPGYLTQRFGDRAGAIAGGLGEGAMAAGMGMDQIPDSVDPRIAAIAALGMGAGTGFIGAKSGELAKYIGLPDFETALATGTVRGADNALPWYQALPATMLREGLLEEFPQSSQEKMWQNWAEGKPLMEGVLKQGVEGMFAGATQAGAVGGLHYMRRPGSPDDVAPPQDLINPEAPPAPVGALPAPVQAGMSTAEEYAGFSGETLAQVAQREADRYAQEAAVRQAEQRSVERHANRDKVEAERPALDLFRQLHEAAVESGAVSLDRFEGNEKKQNSFITGLYNRIGQGNFGSPEKLEARLTQIIKETEKGKWGLP